MELAAGIAGLVSLTDVVLFKGWKFCSLVKNAKHEIKGLLDELTSLNGVLYVLEKRVRTFKSLYNEETDFYTSSNTCLEDCRKCILELEAALDKCSSKESNTIYDKAKSSLKWPLSASKTKELSQKLERLKSTLSESLKADSLDALCQIISTQRSIQDDLKDIRNKQTKLLSREEQKDFDASKDMILNWFSTYKSRKNSKMKKIRHPNTSVWYRECDGYLQWRANPGSRLWFYGIPGAGKSVLTSAVIEDLQMITDSNTALAYFYIEYSEQRSQSFHEVTGSLLRQIAEQRTDTLPVLQHFRGCFEQHECFKDADMQQVLSLFRELSGYFSTTMLVVDGIDECDMRKERRDILEFISGIGKQSQSNNSIKIIATSRKIVDIEQSLLEFGSICIAAHFTDVREYVTTELETRLEKGNIDGYGIRLGDLDLKEEIIFTLVDKAHGMHVCPSLYILSCDANDLSGDCRFQWVTCQLDTLSVTWGDENKRDALRNLPRDLPETYRRILQRVDTRNQKIVRDCLLWLCIDILDRTHEIDIEELRDVIAHQNCDGSITGTDIRLGCSSLIRLDDQGHVRFSHFSVKEFLCSSEEVGQWYFIQFEQEQLEAYYAERVIDYTSQCLWRINPKTNGAKRCKQSINNGHVFSRFLRKSPPEILAVGVDSGEYTYADAFIRHLKDMLSLSPEEGVYKWQTFLENILSLLEPKYQFLLTDQVDGSGRLHIAAILQSTPTLLWLMEERKESLHSKCRGLTISDAWLAAGLIFSGSDYLTFSADVLAPALNQLPFPLEVGPRSLMSRCIQWGGLRGASEHDHDDPETEVIPGFRYWLSNRDHQIAFNEILDIFRIGLDIARYEDMNYILSWVLNEFCLTDEEKARFVDVLKQPLQAWLLSRGNRNPRLRDQNPPDNTSPTKDILLETIRQQQWDEAVSLLRLGVQSLFTDEELIFIFHKILVYTRCDRSARPCLQAITIWLQRLQSPDLLNLVVNGQTLVISVLHFIIRTIGDQDPFVYEFDKASIVEVIERLCEKSTVDPLIEDRRGLNVIDIILKVCKHKALQRDILNIFKAKKSIELNRYRYAFSDIEQVLPEGKLIDEEITTGSNLDGVPRPGAQVKERYPNDIKEKVDEIGSRHKVDFAGHGDEDAFGATFQFGGSFEEPSAVSQQKRSRMILSEDGKSIPAKKRRKRNRPKRYMVLDS